MDANPLLRPIEAFPMQQDGKTLVYLRDPQHIAQPLGVSPVAYFIMSHFDGRHAFLDIQEAYSKQFGELLLSDDLEQFIDLLDRHYYLYSERFLEHQRKIVEEFRRLPARAPAHVGGVYKDDPAALKIQLDGYFTAQAGPGKPEWRRTGSPPKAIVAPHIDFHRGGPAYAWAYKELAEAAGADLYILLGTSHCSGENPFTLTLKDFATPLGMVETDKEFVMKLQKGCKDDLFAEEYLHRTEHSLEFQVVFLKYIAERMAETAAEKVRPFKILPILVSSFHSMMKDGILPEKDPRVEIFLRSLQELVGSEMRRVCFVAGVDLAHVGMQFGDRHPITSEFLKWVEAEDQRLIDRVAALDAPGFFHEVAKDEDRRRICGFAPLYLLIHLLDGSRGKNLKYSQAFTKETGSAVTFTSMVFE